RHRDVQGRRRPACEGPERDVRGARRDEYARAAGLPIRQRHTNDVVRARRRAPEAPVPPRGRQRLGRRAHRLTGSGAAGARTILVADDNPSFAGLLRATLEEAGYDVVTASTGLAAVAAMEKHDVGLAVLDVLMPGISGDAV